MNVADFIAALQREANASEQPLPPVERWNPARCGVMDIKILRDGTWLHEGTPIGRPSLVRLFSRILRRDPDGRYWLVTPVEKVEVAVEDAPFTAMRADRHGTGLEQTIALTTNVGDVVTLGSEHPLRIAGDPEAPRPYVTIRRGLDARLLRGPFYDLAAWAEETGAGYCVRSGGINWRLEP
jgi:uncharacterized protein